MKWTEAQAWYGCGMVRHVLKRWCAEASSCARRWGGVARLLPLTVSAPVSTRALPSASVTPGRKDPTANRPRQPLAAGRLLRPPSVGYARAMARVLVGWIGQTDLRAVAEAAAVGLGPVASALSGRRFDHAVLLLSYRGQEAERYAGWLKRRTPVPIRGIEVELPSPMDFAAVYAAAVKGCETAI